MKKYISLLLIVIVLGSYVFAQEDKVAPGELGGPCPPGMCVVKAGFAIDVFNLHKPRTDCKSGFGLCIKLHVGYTCGFPPFCLIARRGHLEKVARFENGKAIGWFEIDASRAIMHFPLGIELQPGFKEVDNRWFHVDENMLLFKDENGRVWAKARAGSYKVERTSVDLVIVLELQKWD